MSNFTKQGNKVYSAHKFLMTSITMSLEAPAITGIFERIRQSEQPLISRIPFGPNEKLGFISDVHMGAVFRPKTMEQLWEASEGVDAFVIVGDNHEGSGDLDPRWMDEVNDLVEKRKCTTTCYWIFGDHDPKGSQNIPDFYKGAVDKIIFESNLHMQGRLIGYAVAAEHKLPHAPTALDVVPKFPGWLSVTSAAEQAIVRIFGHKGLIWLSGEYDQEIAERASVDMRPQDIKVFGHSHGAHLKIINGRQIANPGCWKHPSIGTHVIEVKGGTATMRYIEP